VLLPNEVVVSLGHVDMPTFASGLDHKLVETAAPFGGHDVAVTIVRSEEDVDRVEQRIVQLLYKETVGNQHDLDPLVLGPHRICRPEKLTALDP